MLLRVLSLFAVVHLVLVSEVDENASKTGIEPNFVTIGDHRYYFSPPGIHFDDITLAVQTCADMGATLVSLETQQEFNAVNDYIANVLNMDATPFWTSGMYVYSDWIWTAIGKRCSYLKWSGPNGFYNYNTRLQSCMFIQYGSMNQDPYCMGYTNANIICEEYNCN